ncbi:MAG: N-acetyltransferase [Burkholderiales bacterium]|nr:N-acetyltransferase [Flavobacterium sp.]
MEETVGIEYNQKNGYFHVDVAGKTEARMTFVFTGTDAFIINHTEVNAGFNGKGFGQKMVEKAVAFARDEGFKIIPLCPFVKNVFDKTPAFNDVLK